jgi:cation transporter-like permease
MPKIRDLILFYSHDSILSWILWTQSAKSTQLQTIVHPNHVRDRRLVKHTHCLIHRCAFLQLPTLLRMLMRRLSHCAVYCVLVVVGQCWSISTSTTVGNPLSSTMAAKKLSAVNASDMNSSVLLELKETIRRQAAEIALLKQQHGDNAILNGYGKAAVAAAAQPPVSLSSHHGGGGEVSMEQLRLYLDRPFYDICRQRVGWLGLFMISLSGTAVIMSGFEHMLASQVELAFFVPFLAGHGGNTGGQAVGTVLSALSAGVVTASDAPRVIRKEALSGLAMGLVLGSIVGPVAHYGMGISMPVATVIVCTIPIVSTIAATLGSAIPFCCLALGLNPSVIAAPAMTSLVDVSGLLSYFWIATQLLSFYGIHLK